MPNLEGLRQQEARKLLIACDLVPEFQSEVVISEVAPGFVVKQNPASGSVKKAGDTLKFSSSLGVFLPSFADWTEAEVREWLERSGFSYEVHYARNSFAIGTIYSQSPVQASYFHKEQIVILDVSEGLWVEVPNLIGIKFNEAVEALQDKSLVVIHASGPSKEQELTDYSACSNWRKYPVVSHVEFLGDKPFEGDTVRLHTKYEFALPTKISHHPRRNGETQAQPCISE